MLYIVVFLSIFWCFHLKRRSVDFQIPRAIILLLLRGDSDVMQLNINGIMTGVFVNVVLFFSQRAGSGTHNRLQLDKSLSEWFLTMVFYFWQMQHKLITAVFSHAHLKFIRQILYCNSYQEMKTFIFYYKPHTNSNTQQYHDCGSDWRHQNQMTDFRQVTGSTQDWLKCLQWV